MAWLMLLMIGAGSGAAAWFVATRLARHAKNNPAVVKRWVEEVVMPVLAPEPRAESSKAQGPKDGS